MLMFSLFFGIMLMMFYCYISILCVAWNQRRRVIDPLNGKKRGYDHRNTKALWWAPTKTVMILITIYCCCWMPTGKTCYKSGFLNSFKLLVSILLIPVFAATVW